MPVSKIARFVSNSRTVNRSTELRLNWALTVNRLTKDVEDSSERTAANWHGYRTG